MQIKVIVNKPGEIFSVLCYETENKEFIEEIQKYKCPIRLACFTDEFKETYPNEVKELIESEITNLDLVIDLEDRTKEIIESNYSVLTYIEETKNLFDKYGNELEEYEELSDYSQGSDRGYEMALDNELYRN